MVMCGCRASRRAQLEIDLKPLRLEVAKYFFPDAAFVTGPVRNRNCQSEIRAYLLHAWLEKTKDPAHKVCLWLWAGDSANIDVQFDNLDGIMPRVDGDDLELSADQLWIDLDTFVNYVGVDSVDAVRNKLWKFEESGWLLFFDIAKQVVDI